MPQARRVVNLQMLKQTRFTQFQPSARCYLMKHAVRIFRAGSDSGGFQLTARHLAPRMLRLEHFCAI